MNGKLVFSAQHSFTRLLQRIVNCDKMQKTYSRLSLEHFDTWIAFLSHHIHELQTL